MLELDTFIVVSLIFDWFAYCATRQRLYTWVFYTWWAQTEKHKDQMLSERLVSKIPMETVLAACHWCQALSSLYQAVLHEEQSHLQRAWRCWKEKINDKEKQTASIQMYLDTLPYTTVTTWKDISTEIQDRWNKTLKGDCWTCSVWS